MKFFILSLFILINSACLLNAQISSNILPSVTDSFKNNLHLAKIENKLLLIDCYATWCLPCKKMDAEVFENAQIQNLLSDYRMLRLQIDTTKKDSKRIKQYYETAAFIVSKYNIQELPTIIVLNGDGELVYKQKGFIDSVQFAALLKNLENPKNQYYYIVNQFKRGILPVTKWRLLAEESNRFDDTLITKALFDTFSKSVVERSATSWSDDDMEFVVSNLNYLHTDSPLFKYLIKHQDSLARQLKDYGILQRTLNEIIYDDFLAPFSSTVNDYPKKLDWQSIKTKLTNRFGKFYAKCNIIRAQKEISHRLKMWEIYTRSIVQEMILSHPENMQANIFNIYNLNGAALEVFDYSSNKDELEQAVNWVNLAINMMTEQGDTKAALIDTKAGLLYKAGNIKEAIKLQQAAVKISNGIEVFKKNLQKMQAHEITWKYPNYKL